MTGLLDANGVEVDKEEFCAIGSTFLHYMANCTIKKDDEVYVIKLNFGDATYSKRIPFAEFTKANLEDQWKELLTNAFAAHAIGARNRGMIADMKNGIKAPEPK